MNYTFQFSEVLTEIPYLLGGAVVTLEIAFISFWGGAIIGLGGALAKVYGGPALKKTASTYVTALTNTPALVQIFLLYYALPDAGILLGSMTAVLIGLVLNAGAYLTEIIRAGIISVRQSEMDAGITLGMSRLQLVRYVLLPHTAKTIYAPLSNFFVWLVLGSSLAALFGVEELTGRAINVSTANLRSIETFAVVAVIYIVITVFASASLALAGRWMFRVKAKVF
ncbi:MAG: amino acid ABC transporter permease [Gammaproteobacteria bacterium]|nr:amino acid ABC transporter permease [Gammaproteobacteria bacterium]